MGQIWDNGQKNANAINPSNAQQTGMDSAVSSHSYMALVPVIINQILNCLPLTW